MFVRLVFFWIDSLIIFFNVNQGDGRTYADEYYGRIRGPNRAKSVDASVVFLIVFGCLIGGFFIVCIFGTLILGFFDNGFRWPFQTKIRRNKSSNRNIHMNTHL